MIVPLCRNSVLTPNQLTSIGNLERKVESKDSKSNVDNFCMLPTFNAALVHLLRYNHWDASVISGVKQIAK